VPVISGDRPQPLHSLVMRLTAPLTKAEGSPVDRVLDAGRAAQSIDRLAGLDFRVAVFGHGRAISGDAVSRFREYAARR
jgi:hypothetical protein